MSDTQLDDLNEESVFDLNEAIPETELLDNSIQKGRAQLSVKTRRHRPSRSRFRDSVSSTEGDESLERKCQDSPLHSARSPLHAMRGSSPSPDSLLSSSSPALRSPAFSFDSSLVRRSPEEGGTGSAAPKGRYRQLTNATSQEALVTPPSTSPSRLCPSPDCSPIYLRRGRRPDSEVLVSDNSRDSSPADSGSHVIFDKKTKRRFLDLGVTLRRSYVRVRKEKTNRLSMGSREPSESPSRSSGSFVPFSWFPPARGSVSSGGTPPCSPRLVSQDSHPRKSHSQESALSDEFSPRSPPHTSGASTVESSSTSRSSHPYQTLSQSSGDEPTDEPLCLVSSWSTHQVCQWLRGLNMEHYVPEFEARNVDGEQLLQMDSSKLKSLGVISSSDRSALKRRIKEMHTASEKERKAQDKLERQKEKQRKKDQEQRRS